MTNHHSPVSRLSREGKGSREERRRETSSPRAIRGPGLGSLAGAFAAVAAVSLGVFGVTAVTAATTSVGLGTASPFAVLAGSTITNTGSSVITGDVGLSPGTSITGFPPGTISGTQHIADATAVTAQTDLTTAYLNAAGQTPTATVSADLGGTTLAPGVYRSTSSMALTGTVTLNAGGDASAVFIFQAASTLTTASSASVVLENGAQACNVFWQVGSSATLGTTTNFAGTVLALTSVTLDTGATVSGRVLARNGAVTLDDNHVTVPVCSTSPTTTTTSPTTTTTSPTTTTTVPVIPTGAPQTGFGGTAGSGTTPWLPLGLGATGLAALFGVLAYRARVRRLNAGRGSVDDGSGEV